MNPYYVLRSSPILTYNLQQMTISNFAAFSKITDKAFFMRILCSQMILMKYYTLFFFEN